MLYLIIAALGSSAVAIGFKLVSVWDANTERVILLNYSVAVIAAAIQLVFHRDSTAVIGGVDIPFYLLAAALGFFMIMNLRFTKRSTDYNGLNSTTFFGRIGFLPCLLLSALIWKEIPNLKQTIGIVLLVFGMIEMLRSMGHVQISNVVMLLLLTFSGGMIALLNAVYSRCYPQQAQLWFLCIMFITAFVCSVFLLFRDKNALCFTRKDILCGLLIGVMNAVSNLFMLKCLSMLSVNVVMPSVSASNMLISALIGHCFFKEKLNAHTWLALALTVISLLLTN